MNVERYLNGLASFSDLHDLDEFDLGLVSGHFASVTAQTSVGGAWQSQQDSYAVNVFFGGALLTGATSTIAGSSRPDRQLDLTDRSDRCEVVAVSIPQFVLQHLAADCLGQLLDKDHRLR